MQNPTHTYTNTGSFYPLLLANNHLNNSVFGLGPVSITVGVHPPQPAISGISLAGDTLLLEASNGVPGTTSYLLLASTNLVFHSRNGLPLPQTSSAQAVPSLFNLPMW